jgi:hypothetical protein
LYEKRWKQRQQTQQKKKVLEKPCSSIDIIPSL